MACQPDLEDSDISILSVEQLSEGGLDDSIFISPPSPTQGLHCPICMLVLKEPHLLSCCGKHICQVCLQLIQDRHQPCPCCRTETFCTILNKEKRGMILELKVYCSNRKYGCDWTGELLDEQRHLDNRCNHVVEVCQYGCGEKHPRSTIQIHEKDECVNRPIEVKLESFIRQTEEKLTEQEKEILELKLREQRLSQQLNELKETRQTSHFEVIEENVYFAKGVWRLYQYPPKKDEWSSLVEKMREGGVAIVLPNTITVQEPFIKIKGERRVVNVMKALIAQLELSVATTSTITSIVHHKNEQSIIKAIEQEFQVCIEVKAKDKPNKDNERLTTRTTAQKKLIIPLPFDITLQVTQGDMTSEHVDVVVNLTTPDLQLVGGVGEELLAKGGADLQAACDTLRTQGIRGVEGKVVETRCEGMGELQCKSIFHVVFEGKDPKKLVKMMANCLDRAEKMKYSSIAFPPLWNKDSPYSLVKLIGSIEKAFKQFTAHTWPQYMKVVTLQQKMLQEFTKALDESNSKLNHHRGIIADVTSQPLEQSSSSATNDHHTESSSDSSHHCESEIIIHGSNVESVRDAENRLQAITTQMQD